MIEIFDTLFNIIYRLFALLARMISMLLESDCSQVIIILSFSIDYLKFIENPLIRAINYMKKAYILILIADYLPFRRCNKGFLNRRRQFHLDEYEYKDRIILCSKNILNGKENATGGSRSQGISMNVTPYATNETTRASLRKNGFSAGASSLKFISLRGLCSS